MKKLFHLGTLGLILVLVASCVRAVKAPEAILPIPEQKQVDWQKMETYAFVCLGLNTFNDQEWGYGDVDPKLFNPTQLDCEQWVQTFVKAGMTGVLFTAKHHDGFCLWPFAGTEYSVKNSPWKNGQGDVVKELSEACKKYGLKFAVYLSPWDRNHSQYGKEEYVSYFHQQLDDLLTNYGSVFEVWFDGANGGDGWYGGANDKRTIDRKNYYDYPRLHELINRKQPEAVIFADGGPGCRWVGNESGFAGATNWSFLRKGEVYPGYPLYKELQYGHADGDIWVAAECDVSIRPGWYYHKREDTQVKTPEQLVDLYYRSVGHNATLLLNFPITPNGLVHPVDSANAVRFHEIIKEQLANNLVAGVAPKVSNERGGVYNAQALTDGDYDSYWATEDSVTTATIEFDFASATTMNRMMLQEYIPLGQRVQSFLVEYLQGDQWIPVQLKEETTTIGYKRLLRFSTITSNAIRVRITEARGPLCLNNVAVYYAADAEDSYQTAVVDLQSLPFTLLDVDQEEVVKLKDNNIQTTCFVAGNQLVIDLGQLSTIHSLYYLPDQDKYGHGLISNYEIGVGNSLDKVDRVIKRGEFSNIKNNPIKQSVYFSPIEARYLFFKATRMIEQDTSMGFAEFGIQ